MCVLCRLSIPQDMYSMISAQTANLVSNQPLIDLKMFHLVTCKISIALPLSIPQIACRVDYVMVNCLIDAVYKYIIKHMSTSRNRPLKINKIPSKIIKQPKYVFRRLITKVHQPCQRVEHRRYIKQKGQSRMDNPQKLATLGTRDEHEHSKQHNTICVGYRYTQTNTNNVNKS